MTLSSKAQSSISKYWGAATEIVCFVVTEKGFLQEKWKKKHKGFRFVIRQRHNKNKAKTKYLTILQKQFTLQFITWQLATDILFPYIIFINTSVWI